MHIFAEKSFEQMHIFAEKSFEQMHVLVYNSFEQMHFWRKKGGMSMFLSEKHIKNCVSLKLGGINSPEDAAKYIHKIVSVDDADLKPLEENEYYIGDLRGISVINHDTGEHVGTLKDVLITGGNDVLDIETEDGRQVLVPMVHEFVKNIDIESGRMEIHFIDGMLNGD